MWTSTMWSSPCQFGPQTRSRRLTLDTTALGSVERTSSRSNSILRERHGLTSHVHLAARGVDPKVAERANPVGRRCVPGSAHQRADPGDHLRHRARLRHVVVRSRGQPDELVAQIVGGGQHQDVRVGERAHALAHVDAAQLGKVQVQKDDVRLERLREVHGGPSVGRLSQLEVLALERRDDDLTDIPIVVDDQHAHGPSIPVARTFLHLWAPVARRRSPQGCSET